MPIVGTPVVRIPILGTPVVIMPIVGTTEVRRSICIYTYKYQ